MNKLTHCLFGMLVTGIFSTGLMALELQGESVQGNLMFGRVSPDSEVTLDGDKLMLTDQGHFVIGFGREETGTRLLKVTTSDGGETIRELAVSPREYAIERVDGLPPSKVTPDPSVSKRIQEEARLVSAARSRRDQRDDFTETFIWPARGRISGVYGSQRILNGEPRRPHFGLDIAAPEGTEVLAPASGVITLAHGDMYFSGGTILLDHGHGLSSTFLHLSKVLVEAGQTVKQGDVIGLIGATGRATGPHLDWRMNWLNRRVDPRPLVAGSPEPLEE